MSEFYLDQCGDVVISGVYETSQHLNNKMRAYYELFGEVTAFVCGAFNGVSHDGKNIKIKAERLGMEIAYASNDHVYLMPMNPGKDMPIKVSMVENGGLYIKITKP